MQNLCESVFRALHPYLQRKHRELILTPLSRRVLWGFRPLYLINE